MNMTREVLIGEGIRQTELAERLGKGFNMANLYANYRVCPPCLICVGSA